MAAYSTFKEFQIRVFVLSDDSWWIRCHWETVSLRVCPVLSECFELVAHVKFYRTVHIDFPI